MVLLVAYAFYCVEMCNLYGFIISLYIITTCHAKDGGRLLHSGAQQ